MAERRTHNKVGIAMPSTPAGGGSVATVEAYGGDFVDLVDLADDGAGVPVTRFFEAPAASPSGGGACGSQVRRSSTPQGMQPAPNGVSTGSPARSQQKAAEGDCTTLDDVILRLSTCCADIDGLRRKLDQVVQKQEDADSVHRGQLDCISERIFEAERNLRQAEERQDDAIEKASATFQKQSNNLMHVINQVNRNFEHLSEQIQQQGVTITAFEQTLTQLQASTTQAAHDARSSMLAVETLGHEVTSLEQHQQDVDQEGQQYQQRVSDLCINVQALRDAVLLMTPQTQFQEAEARQRLAHEQLEALRGLVVQSQARQDVFEEQVVAVRAEVARLLGGPGLMALSVPPLSRGGEFAQPSPTDAELARFPFVTGDETRVAGVLRTYGLPTTVAGLSNAAAPLLGETPGLRDESPTALAYRLQQHSRAAGPRVWGNTMEVRCDPESTTDEVKGLLRQLAAPSPTSPVAAAHERPRSREAFSGGYTSF